MKKLLIPSLLFIFVGPLFALAWIYFSLPDVKELKSCFTTSLYEVKVCPGTANYVKLSQISNIAKRAILVSEDGTFYSHNGFDWFELKESFLENLKSLEYKRGGSTITQQLAKNAFLNNKKSIFRKLLEAHLAGELERNFTKDELLEKYLNMIEFGPKLYGIKAASNKYFGKSPSQLHLLEAVWLAHLLPNPKVYSRGIKKGQLTPYSKERVQILLQRLVKYGDISRAKYEFAKSQISSFPWSHLSAMDFENVGVDTESQEKALEEIMRGKDWLDESSLPEPSAEEDEEFLDRPFE
ncbi:transglycosylase domain-containing protein [bacterium]|nr:transglycosylase domain-containing protein [bacterium]